jgi:hypothetical protein
MAFLNSEKLFLLMLRSRSLGLLSILWTLVFTVPALAYADADANPLAYQVKSAFLYNFTKFIEWPELQLTTNGNLSICVVGEPEMYEVMRETIGRKLVNNHELQFKMIDHPGEANACQVLFLSFTDQRRLQDWLGAVSTAAVLTVSDSPGFIRGGGMIQFVIVDGKIRFDINQSAANRLKIKLSSKLLSLARNVN